MVEMVQFYNSTQVPQFGCGYRRVLVKEGNKFAHLLDYTDLTRAKMPLKDWHRTKKETVPYKANKVVKIMKEACKFYEKTEFVKNIIAELEGDDL